MDLGWRAPRPLGTSGRQLYWGTDDNASAVAILLEVAKQLAAARPRGRGVIFASFDGEEPPYFLTEAMGSEHFARHPIVPMSHIGLMICMDLVALRLRATQCPACRLRGGSLPARGWLFRGKAHGGTARSPTAIAVHTVPARLCFWISPFRGLKARPQCCEG